MPRTPPQRPCRTEVRLQAGQPLRLTRARGLVVVVDAGTIWITVEGCGDDVFVDAGGCFTIPGDGLTLVEAIGSARASIGPRREADRSPAPANAGENRGNPDLAAVGRIKSAVPFRLPTALRACSFIAACLPRYR